VKLESDHSVVLNRGRGCSRVCVCHKLDRKGWWPFPRACGRACCCDRRNRIKIDACILSRVVLPRGAVIVDEFWLTMSQTHFSVRLACGVLCPPPSTADRSPAPRAQVAELPWETRCRPFTRPFRTSARCVFNCVRRLGAGDRSGDWAGRPTVSSVI
jgi:hypothetical protein